MIGAGPHALSLLARIIDDAPDLLDEAERAYIAGRAGTHASPHSQVKRALKRRFDGPGILCGVRVFDSHGEWLAQWASDFSALEIHHCRSHSDLHPCPNDFQSLRVWAAAQKRQDESWHMQYLDRESARASGFTGPYTLPGTKLYLDFCANLTSRYKLKNLVQRATVASVQVVPPRGARQRCSFRLVFEDGTEVLAERVVCAMGPGPMFAGMRANMPVWCEGAVASLRDAGFYTKDGSQADDMPRICHSSQLVRELLSRGAPAKARLRGARVLVIGGGQTSGHLALVALRNEAAAVTLAARRPIKVKPFDVDLELVGQRRGEVLSRFWALTLPERLAFIARIRGGGSMAAEVYAELRTYARDSAACNGVEDELDDGPNACTLYGETQGIAPETHAYDGSHIVGDDCGRRRTSRRLMILEEVEVASAIWRPSGGADGGIYNDGAMEVRFDNGGSDVFDYIWLATGGELDLSLVPIFQGMLEQRPIPVHRGLPALQPDLSWDQECPLYVMGAFAQLELGPDALNLAGCRAGSVRIAKALRPVIRATEGRV